MLDAASSIMSNPRSIEYAGVGQSGYCAGRRDHDLALERELHAHNEIYPRGVDEEMIAHELVGDDRFTGRGGTIPREPE